MIFKGVNARSGKYPWIDQGRRLMGFVYPSPSGGKPARIHAGIRPGGSEFSLTSPWKIFRYAQRSSDWDYLQLHGSGIA